MMKAMMAGALGFAVGAGVMLMPGNQRMKRQAQRSVDKMIRMAKSW